MYKVVRFFTDLQDNGHAYNAGETYPRRGYKPTKKRIDELASSNNMRGKPLIAEVDVDDDDGDLPRDTELV